MGKSYGERLCESLDQVDWSVVARTYGNSHATLIGSIVRWWVESDRHKRWALDGGATCRPTRGGRPLHSDALLGERKAAVGIVEVEGSRIENAMRRIEAFFDPSERDKAVFAPLKFALIVGYPTAPKGRGDRRDFPAPISAKDERALAKAAVRFPCKPLIVVSVQKRFLRTPVEEVRTRNEYHCGDVRRVSAVVYQGGSQSRDRCIWQAGTSR